MINLWECLLLLKTAFPDFSCSIENNMCKEERGVRTDKV